MSHPEERRSSARQTQFESDSLIVETRLESGTTQAIDARLLDVSEGGLGIVVRIPVLVGVDADVDGSLTRSGEFILLRGRARVAYCLYRENNGLFRVGLAFREVYCQKPDGTPVSLMGASEQPEEN